MNVQVDVEGSQHKGLPTTSCCDKLKQEKLCCEQHDITNADISQMPNMTADILLFTTMTICSYFC